MNNFWPKLKENPVFAVLLSVLLIVIIVTLIFVAMNQWKQNYFIGKSATTQRIITITGEGSVTVVPDIAFVTLGLQTEKITVTEAQNENSETMNSLINQLKDLDIDEEDIKTANYQINPSYDWKDGVRTLRGYIVSQNVRVKIRETDKVDDVLRIAGSLNLNQIGGLSFNVDEPENYRQEARKKALVNAKKKAEELVDIMGVKLGKIISFSESGGIVPPAPRFYALEATDGIIGGSGGPVIEEGSQEIRVIATITYELD